MQDDKDDTFTQQVFKLLENQIDPRLVNIFLMNKRRGRKLRWKDDLVDFKLYTGNEFHDHLKHDEEPGEEKLYLVKYDDVRHTLMRMNAINKATQFFDNGHEGFQFILCDGGLHIQHGNYRLILNENKKQLSKSNFIWYNNHNDYKMYT